MSCVGRASIYARGGKVAFRNRRNGSPSRTPPPFRGWKHCQTQRTAFETHPLPITHTPALLPWGGGRTSSSTYPKWRLETYAGSHGGRGQSEKSPFRRQRTENLTAHRAIGSRSVLFGPAQLNTTQRPCLFVCLFRLFLFCFYHNADVI